MSSSLSKENLVTCIHAISQVTLFQVRKAHLVKLWPWACPFPTVSFVTEPSASWTRGTEKIKTEHNCIHSGDIINHPWLSSWSYDPQAIRKKWWKTNSSHQHHHHHDPHALIVFNVRKCIPFHASPTQKSQFWSSNFLTSCLSVLGLSVQC